MSSFLRRKPRSVAALHAALRRSIHYVFVQNVASVVGGPAEYMPSDVLPSCRQSTGTTSSLSAVVSDQASETVAQLPLDTATEHPQRLPVSSPATCVVPQSTDHCDQSGAGAATMMTNPTAQQWTGCVSSTSSNSNFLPSTSVASPSSCQASATPTSQLLLSGTRSSSSSSSGRGSMMFGPDDFIELFRSRVMSEARGESTLSALQGLRYQRQRHRVCVQEQVCCRLF